MTATGTVPAATTSTLAGAITAGLREAMRRDDSVILMGEDIGPLGGVFRVTAGLQDEFGADRVRDVSFRRREFDREPVFLSGRHGHLVAESLQQGVVIDHHAVANFTGIRPSAWVVATAMYP